MKKLLLMLAISMVSAQSFAVSNENPVPNSINAILNHTWERTPDNTWVGQSGVRYQIDKSTRRIIFLSSDSVYNHTTYVDSTAYLTNRSATLSNDPADASIWKDKSGKWYKLGDKKLLWSNDNGKIWRETSICTKWQGGDGNWYKFDKDLNVWVNKQ